MTRTRNLVLAVMAGLAVAAYVVGQVTSDGGASQRLFASSPSTSARAPVARGGAAPSTPGATSPGGSQAGTTTNPSTDAAGTVTSTPSPSTGASNPAGGDAASGGPGGSASRNNGVFGGIDDYGLDTTGGTPSGRGGGTATSTTTPPGPGVNTLGLTRDDNGKTFIVNRTDIIVLRLESASGAPWSEPVSSAPAVRRDSSLTADGVLTATFTADASGTATVSSTASPTCSTATPPCLAPTALFSVTINVVG